MRALISITLAVLLVLFMGCRQDSPSSRYLIPQGYVGPIWVEYAIPGAPELSMEEGRYLIHVPSSGRVQTSTALPQGWQTPDDFYYVSRTTRQRLPAENESYPVGTRPPDPLVRGGSVSIGTNMPVTLQWFIGTQSSWTTTARSMATGWIGRPRIRGL